MGREISGVDEMSDFLLELRSEEIPARMQAGARAELEKLFRGQMAAAGVAVGELTLWSTPRRLALIARGLPVATQAVREEVKGPKASAPEQALAGFLRKTGLTREQLEERDGVFFAVTEKPGRATADVLAEAIPAIVRGFAWPKSQRWAPPRFRPRVCAGSGRFRVSLRCSTARWCHVRLAASCRAARRWGIVSIPRARSAWPMPTAMPMTCAPRMFW